MDTFAAPRLRLGILLWIVGIPGVVLVTVVMLPQLLRQVTLSAPLELVMAASLAQSALLVALAAWAGVALAPPLGLRAPVFEALALTRPIASALRPQLLPGLSAGTA